MTEEKKATVKEAKKRLAETGWLPKAQIRILAALNRARGPLNRDQIAERAEVPETHVIGFTLTQYASKPNPTLVDLGFAKVAEITVEGLKEKVFSITDAGRAALERCRREI